MEIESSEYQDEVSCVNTDHSFPDGGGLHHAVTAVVRRLRMRRDVLCDALPAPRSGFQRVAMPLGHSLGSGHDDTSHCV